MTSSEIRHVAVIGAGTIGASWAAFFLWRSLTVAASINRLGAEIAELNQHFSSSPDGQQNPGLEAQAHAALEELSQFAKFTVLREPNGSFNVYLGGQTPLFSFFTIVDITGWPARSGTRWTVYSTKPCGCAALSVRIWPAALMPN